MGRSVLVPWCHGAMLDSWTLVSWSPGALRSRPLSPVRSVCGSRIATREGCRGAANERPLCGRGSTGSRVSRAIIGRIVYIAAPALLWWSDHSSTRTCASVRSADCRLQYLGRLGSQDEGVKLQGGAAPRAGSCSLGPWDYWIARLSPSWRFVIDGRLVWGEERGGQLGQSDSDSRGGRGPISIQHGYANSECRAPGRQAEAVAVAVGGMDGQKASDALGRGIQTSPHSHTSLTTRTFTFTLHSPAWPQTRAQLDECKQSQAGLHR
jgi:hypothetical protein